jgi:hypothetical protein
VQRRKGREGFGFDRIGFLTLKTLRLCAFAALRELFIRRFLSTHAGKGGLDLLL